MKDAQNMTTRILKTAALLTVVLLLSACGGGGDGGNPDDDGGDNTNPPVTNQNANGIFTGTANINGGGTSVNDLKGIIHNNRFMVFSTTHHILYDGTISSISGDSYTATMRVYLDGEEIQSDVAVTGIVNTSSSITGEMKGTAIADGSFELVFQDIYNRGATLDKIVAGERQREGSVFIFKSNHSTDGFVVKDNNSMDVSFQSGTTTPETSVCSFEGEALIPDPNINVYTITQINNANIEINCSELTGTPNMTGFAVSVDGIDPDDTIWYVTSNSTHSIFAILTIIPPA